MMISAGELVDMRGILDQDTDLTRQQQSDLIEECHRQRHLIEEMAEIRYTNRGGRVFTSFEAASKFFGISYWIAEYLFDPSFYPLKQRGRKSVVRRLREVVKQGVPRENECRCYD